MVFLLTYLFEDCCFTLLSEDATSHFNSAITPWKVFVLLGCNRNKR